VGVLDLDKVQENILSNESGKAAEDLIESFKKEKRSLEKFRDSLEGAVQAIGEGEPQHPLVFFIDELDRCRPSFAIELLERVKHLFDVKNIVFVLSIDKKQLEAITAAVYGERIDAPEYLRRFIDIDFSLPSIHNKEYVRNLVKQYDFSSFFSARIKYHELSGDEESFVLGFTLLANVYELSLRSIERCFTRAAIVLLQTQENQYLDPIFLAYLVPPSILFIPLATIVFKLGLFDTRWALILTYPTFLIPFCTWLLMGYFRSIPFELEECALMDGATRFEILWKIILPLSVPGLISAGIFAFTLSWNEFIYALTFISSSETKTVPVGVITELVEGDVYHWGSLMAGALLGSFPVAVLYSFFVDHYVSGMTGAVKE
jgi:hypothetical protein